MNKHTLTLDELIKRLEAQRKKHGGDMIVTLNDTHSNLVAITSAKFVTGSFDSIELGMTETF